MSPFAQPGDTIEQSACRERTEEEQRAVEMCEVLRVLVNAGTQKIRFDSDRHYDETWLSRGAIA